MSELTSFKLIGDKELAEKLTKFVVVTDQKLEWMGHLAAQPIQNAWKRNVLAKAFKTGTYLRSIHTEVLTHSKDKLAIMIGTDITDPPYPWFLEVGTSRMAARPTALPAYDEHKDEAIEEFTAVYKTFIDMMRI